MANLGSTIIGIPITILWICQHAGRVGKSSVFWQLVWASDDDPPEGLSAWAEARAMTNLFLVYWLVSCWGERLVATLMLDRTMETFWAVVAANSLTYLVLVTSCLVLILACSNETTGKKDLPSRTEMHQSLHGAQTPKLAEGGQSETKDLDKAA